MITRQTPRYMRVEAEFSIDVTETHRGHIDEAISRLERTIADTADKILQGPVQRDRKFLRTMIYRRDQLQRVFNMDQLEVNAEVDVYADGGFDFETLIIDSLDQPMVDPVFQVFEEDLVDHVAIFELSDFSPSER